MMKALGFEEKDGFLIMETVDVESLKIC